MVTDSGGNSTPHKLVILCKIHTHTHTHTEPRCRNLPKIESAHAKRQISILHAGTVRTLTKAHEFTRLPLVSSLKGVCGTPCCKVPWPVSKAVMSNMKQQLQRTNYRFAHTLCPFYTSTLGSVLPDNATFGCTRFRYDGSL